MTDEPSTKYPPQYEEIRAWVKTQEFVTHGTLQRHFNLTYYRSRILIVLLLDDGVIRGYWARQSDARGRFTVVK